MNRGKLVARSKDCDKRDRIVAMIKTLNKDTPLITRVCLEDAIIWSDKHPESKPHFLINGDNHVVVY